MDSRMKEYRSLVITICASSDSFGAYSEDCPGIYGAGDTVEEAKANALEALDILREEWPEEIQPQAVCEHWPIEWHYDYR